jgi:hypothetical protein
MVDLISVREYAAFRRCVIALLLDSLCTVVGDPGRVIIVDFYRNSSTTPIIDEYKADPNTYFVVVVNDKLTVYLYCCRGVVQARDRYVLSTTTNRSITSGGCIIPTLIQNKITC